jgi:hypothetical protein
MADERLELIASVKNLTSGPIRDMQPLDQRARGGDQGPVIRSASLRRSRTRSRFKTYDCIARVAGSRRAVLTLANGSLSDTMTVNVTFPTDGSLA